MQFIMTMYGSTAAGGDDVIESFSFCACESEISALSYCFNINSLELKDGRWAYARIVEEQEKIIPARIIGLKIINTLNDNAIQKFLWEVDSQELAKALKGEDKEVQDKIFRNMSKRAAGMLREDMEYMGPLRRIDVRFAQEKIIRIIMHQLNASETPLNTKEEPEENDSSDLDLDREEWEDSDNLDLTSSDLDSSSLSENKFIEQYTEMIKLNPNDAGAYKDRAEEYYEIDNYDLAIADYTEAIRIDPNDRSAYYNRINMYFHKGDYDQAIVDCSHVIKLFPKAFIAYTLRGDAYREKGSYDEGIADYTQTLKLNPDNAGVYLKRSDAYYKKGDYESAIADLTQAIKLDPKDAKAYIIRGKAYQKKGDKAKAEADFAKARELGYEEQ